MVYLSQIYCESMVSLSGTYPRCQQLFPVCRINFMTIMEFGLKWVHMARYELMLRLDGALWLRIILKPILTPKGAIKDPKIPKKVLKSVPNQPREGER